MPRCGVLVISANVSQQIRGPLVFRVSLRPLTDEGNTLEDADRGIVLKRTERLSTGIVVAKAERPKGMTGGGTRKYRQDRRGCGGWGGRSITQQKNLIRIVSQCSFIGSNYCRMKRFGKEGLTRILTRSNAIANTLTCTPLKPRSIRQG